MTIIPSARGLSAAIRDSSTDIVELLLFGGSMFALGIWMGTEFAWRASFAIDRAVLAGVPERALFASFFLLVVMGFVGLLAEE